MSKNHIHKYYKTSFPKSGAIIYRCRLTNCSHFIHEHMVVGRLSICWRCGAIFEIIRRSLRSKKLHCENCTRGRYNKVKVIENKTTENILDKILSDIAEDDSLSKREALGMDK